MTASQKTFHLLLLLPRQVWRELNDLGQCTAPEMPLHGRRTRLCALASNSTRSDASATSPWVGLANAQFNGRTVRIKDSARERHGLFRCGAFRAACVAVHRSDLREWHPPGPNGLTTFQSLIRFRLLWASPRRLGRGSRVAAPKGSPGTSGASRS
jgi:hypothetical protein